MSDCPCDGCDIRKAYARMDLHFSGEDCPYECDEYEAWKKEREVKQNEGSH